MGYGFYDDSAKLPHEPIPLSMFLIIEDVFRVSWQRLKSRSNPQIDIETADEDEVTHDLWEVIVDEVFNKGVVDGFDSERFSVPTRESKIRNFNGDHLDKMPDLLVGVAGRTELDFHRRSQDWLFVECKPINAERTVGVHYGAKGIARFIRGDYAWTMTSALMVGYASTGYAIEPKLGEAMKARAKEFEVVEQPKRCACSLSVHGDDCAYATKHGRTFSYLETGTPAPPIQLRHLDETLSCGKPTHSTRRRVLSFKRERGRHRTQIAL